jgi:hypothetical protein
MLCMIRKERGLVLPPPPSLPPNSCIPAFLPPPPREGGGAGCLHSIMLHTADSAPHAESTTFSRKFGVRAGDIERNTKYLFFKGTF